MYQIKVNNQTEFSVVTENDQVFLNEQAMDWDMQKLPNGNFSIIANGKSFTAIVEEIDKSNKTIRLIINGNPYELVIQEPIDLVLKKMGLNNINQKKADSIKAPMPGLILKVMVTEGQHLKKGDPVLILEAMKMENVFKAPGDSIVKTIKYKSGEAVEKGAVLVELA